MYLETSWATTSSLSTTAFATTTAAVAIVLVVLVVAASWLVVARMPPSSSYSHDSRSITTTNNDNDNNKLLLPPMAKGGFWHVMSKFFSKNLHTYLLELSRNEGTIVSLPFVIPSLFGSAPMHYFIIAEHRMARDILQDPKSTKWYTAYAVFDDAFGGANFFSAEGERYKHTRRNHSVPLGPSCRTEMMTAIGQKLNEWMEERFSLATTTTTATTDVVELDIAKELQLLTCAIIGKVAFDYDLSQDDKHLIVESLELAYTEAFVDLQKNPLRKLLPFAFSKRRRARQATRDLHRICRTMMQSFHSRVEKSTTCLLASMVSDKAYRTDQERICDMVAYLAGGFETVAYTMAWTMLELALNQDLQSKLRKELLQQDSWEKRCQSNRLKECIREAMRLHPVGAAGSLRVTAMDFVSSDDHYIIPKGSFVLIPYYAIQRDAKIFTQPDDFVPDRWASPTPAMDSAWMTFALGRRNCKGQFLANMEMQVILSRLFSEYEWDVVHLGHSEYSVTLKTVGSILRAKRIIALPPKD